MKRLAEICDRRAGLLALIGYALFTVLMTLPVTTRLTTHLVGCGNDPYVHYWNTWWVGEALRRGTNPYFTDMLFHPNGASLVYHNFAWLNIAGSLVLRPFAGPVGAYNLVYLANMALCGFAMYQLTNYVVGSRGAAFIAGLVHAFWPYRMQRAVHPNLISTQWMVWFLLFLMKTVREGRRRHTLLTALFLTLTALARLQLFVLALFPAALYLAHSFFTERERWKWGTFGRLTTIAAITTMALAYPLFPLVQQQIAGEHPGDLFLDEQTTDQSDLLAYVWPNTDHPLREAFLRNPLDATVVFIGYSTLALAIYGVVRERSQTRMWILMAVMSFVLALGPSLRFAGQVYDHIPLPYRLVGWTFPVRIMRNPHRFNILLAIPVAVLVGFGVRAILKRRRQVVAYGLAGLVLFEYLWFPMPTLALEHSPFYDELRAEEGVFGLCDLPMGFSGPAKFYMYLQTIHEKPIIQGKMSRPQRTVNDFIDGDPFTKHFRLTKNRVDPELTAVSRHLNYLAEAGFRYIILHRDPQLEKRQPTDEHWTEWQDWLVAEPIYEDDRIAVHRTSLEYGRDFTFERDLGTDVGIVRAREIPGSLKQGNVLEFELLWGSSEAPRRDLRARFSLVDGQGVERQSVRAKPCEEWPTSEWPPHALAIGRHAFQIDPRLPAGEYSLTAEVVGVGHRATVAKLTIEALPRVFKRPTEMMRAVDASLGEEIRLLGYDLVQEDNDLELTLYWQAVERPAGYYKAFVHVLHPGSGAVVAQHDAVPRDWTYPTNWWERGEVVSDTIVLSMGDVPSGKYKLAVGMYEPDVGDRLAVRDEAGTRQPKNHLVLPDGIAW